MKKKILSLLLIPFLFSGLIGCSSTSSYEDGDYDGLYDNLDPNPTSNEYGFNLYNPKDESLLFKKDTLKVDLRNLLFTDKPVFDKNIAKMSACMTLEGYGDKEKVEILNDKYTNPESETFPLLVQFGFSNVQYHEISNLVTDINDKCGVYLGKHIIKNDNKLTQIIAVVIKGYLGSTGWISNIDFGADTNSYTYVTGAHPDWENKNYHKGFDVTANRIYKIIDKYYSENYMSNADNIVYMSGQSRGGAIANLLAKRFQDEKIKNVTYCINPPICTTENDEGILLSYDNIFNLRCEEDVIRNFPLSEWGFTTYGHTYSYSFIEHKDKFNEYFNTEFQYIDQMMQDDIFNLLTNIIPTREAMYEFREIDDNYPEYSDFATLEEAEEYKKTLDNSVSDPQGKRSYKTEINSSGRLLKPFRVQYYTRPSILVELIYHICININNLTPEAIAEILNVFMEYSHFLSRYIREVLSLERFPTSIDQVNHPHTPSSAVLGVTFAEFTF